LSGGQNDGTVYPDAKSDDKRQNDGIDLPDARGYMPPEYAEEIQQPGVYAITVTTSTYHSRRCGRL
jgi:hypothetical protein